MRENIIEHLRFCATHFSCDGCGGKCSTSSNEPRTKSVITDAADAIEELLKEVQSRENDCINLTGECATYYAQIPKWISVEERLPEIGRIVLVSDGDDIDAACRYKAFTIPDEVETFIWDSVLEVTHWMPLPTPPKGVE